MRLYYLFLSGLLLVALGLGNTLVGYYKGMEYRAVLDELSDLASAEEPENASVLFAIKHAAKNADTDEKVVKATSRRDFYFLVYLGGEIFLGFGLLFLLAAFFLFYRRSSQLGRG